MARSAMMGVGLALGLAIGCAAAPFVVPPVRAGTTPQKWKYTCYDEFYPDEVVRKANKAGMQGWEMVLNHGSHWCFKRPLP